MLVYLQMLDTPEDQLKFEQLYRTYRGLMFHVAKRILNHDSDAEDAVHQAFLSIINHFEKISEVTCPKTQAFVVIIVERKAIDIYRANLRQTALPLDEELYGITVTIPEESEIVSAIERLPARYREVLLLRFKLGFTTKEIGQLFEMSPKSVQRLLWRAKDSLRKALEKDGVEE